MCTHNMYFHEEVRKIFLLKEKNILHTAMDFMVLAFFMQSFLTELWSFLT